MSTPAIAPNEPRMSEASRLIGVFTSPVQTFADIARNPRWLAPFVLMIALGYVMVFVVQNRVGWEQVSNNEMQARMTGRAQERMAQMSDEQRQQQLDISMTMTRVMSYGWPVMALITWSIIAAVLMASFNFVVGTQMTFGQALAVVMYSYVIGLVRTVLATLTAAFGDPESFTFSNPAGTNLGYFISGTEQPVLHTIGSYIDFVSIWMLIVMAIGFSVVGKTKRGSAYAVVFGWYAVIALGATAFAAIF